MKYPWFYDRFLSFFFFSVQKKMCFVTKCMYHVCERNEYVIDTLKHELHTYTHTHTHTHTHSTPYRKMQTDLNHKPSFPISCQVHCSQGAVTFCFPRVMYCVALNI